MITLADGSLVPIESLTGSESLLVWNMLTGQLDEAGIIFIDRDEEEVYNVINLVFSDGSIVKVIGEHGFWDITLNQYVYLTDDARKYIGHFFAKEEVDDEGNISLLNVELISVEITEEITIPLSPVTYAHLCYFVNGMLSMPGGIEGLFNIFEVDSETMAFDRGKMEKDIDMYGVFTYEEFSQLVDLPQEMFEAVNGQYLKVAIGKGLITIERLQDLVD